MSVAMAPAEAPDRRLLWTPMGVLLATNTIPPGTERDFLIQFFAPADVDAFLAARTRHADHPAR